MKRFENKVCLVTGAASGIGKSNSIRICKESANVIVADINENAAKQVASSIELNDGRAIALKIDIANRGDVANMISKTIEAFGRLDCAVNCAGIAGKHTLAVHEYPEDDWINMINIILSALIIV